MTDPNPASQLQSYTWRHHCRQGNPLKNNLIKENSVL
jgi:hypothetical protein